MSKIINKIASFADKLSSRPVVGGLHITDSSIQYILLERGSSKTSKASLRLPPGVIEEGRVKDKKALVQHLKKIKESVVSEDSKGALKISTCLPSSIIYTQHFSIPNVGPDQMKEAVELNLRVNSPIDAEKVYMDWELIRSTEDKYEIMGAFAEKTHIDAYKSALLEAGFYPVIFEFPSLALSWTINKLVGTKNTISLVVNVSADGMDIFLMKKGFIYFNYFVSWKSVRDEEGKITKKSFKDALVDEVYKVINFSENQILESPSEIIFIAPGVDKLVQKVFDENFEGMRAYPLKENVYSASPLISMNLSIWYTAIGSAIRGGWSRGQDKFISLGAEDIEKVFYREQILDFINLWRNIFAGTMAIFLVLLVGTYVVIDFQPQASEEHEILASIRDQQNRFLEFEERARTFNDLVVTISSVDAETDSLLRFLVSFNNMASENNITINRLSMASLGSEVEVVAVAPDIARMLEFEGDLENDERFSNILIPFGERRQESGGTRFKVIFNYSG